MTSSGNDPLARFVARPARFEAAAGTRDSRDALARHLRERASELKLDDMASLRTWLQRNGLTAAHLPRL